MTAFSKPRTLKVPPATETDELGPFYRFAYMFVLISDSLK